MNLYGNFRPLGFTLSPELDNEIMNRVADEISDGLYPDIDRAFPGAQVVTFELPEKPERLAIYTKETDPQDFPMLQDPDYVKKYREGVYPQPVSPFWNTLLSLPADFDDVRNDFMQVYKELTGA
jgi:hypothetical protein